MPDYQWRKMVGDVCVSRHNKQKNWFRKIQKQNKLELFAKRSLDVTKLFLSVIKLLASFSHQRHLVIFYWSLSDSKSPEILTTQADLNNAVVCMVSVLPLISSSTSLFSKLLETAPSA